ncbi:hypothetical protein Gasu2_45100 [Galdieria sulphuraria]|nr:hypothetical protein Gasu2_45100 [Galdieria sulphuraria]
MQQPHMLWSEGDDELHEKANETIRRHLLWSHRVNWEGTQLGKELTKPKETPVRKTVLPATSFGNLNDYGCVICSSDLKRTTVSCLYPCLHRFCYGCILRWLKVKARCPLCLETPQKLLFSIQSSSLFKENDLDHKSPSSRRQKLRNDVHRQGDNSFYASQDSNTVYQETLRGTRRQRDFVLQRAERLKLSRKTEIENSQSSKVSPPLRTDRVVAFLLHHCFQFLSFEFSSNEEFIILANSFNILQNGLD